jgi:hypothetical protein
VTCNAQLLPARLISFLTLFFSHRNKMAPTPIYLLPIALQEYQVERITPPLTGEKCYNCLRAYGKKDDDYDTDEKP